MASCQGVYTVLSLQAQTSLYHCPNICNFLPTLSFFTEIVFGNTVSIQKHPQTANCKNFQNLLQLEECGLYSTEDWACALKKRVLDETGVNGTAFLHKRIPSTNHAQQIIVAFKRLRWAFPDDAIPSWTQEA